MPLPPDLTPLKPFYSREDMRELAWLDGLFVELISDHSRREALARAAKQETLSLVLNAQMALLLRLRDKIHSRYWSLLNGTAAAVE